MVGSAVLQNAYINTRHIHQALFSGARVNLNYLMK